MMGNAVALLRRPGSWVVLAAVAVGLGVGLDAGWVTAGALLSVLVALAPCLLMCALGLCMRHGEGKQCHGAQGESNRKDAALPPGTDNP